MRFFKKNSTPHIKGKKIEDLETQINKYFNYLIEFYKSTFKIKKLSYKLIVVGYNYLSVDIKFLDEKFNLTLKRIFD
ncbi:MAG: hypothetical protein ACFFG0_30260 [Candidatus Thorarchaeota archaeon]